MAPFENRAKGRPGDGNAALEDGHLLTVPPVGGATGHLILGDGEMLGQGTLEPGAVQGGQGGNRRSRQPRVDQGGETRDVGGIEDDDGQLTGRTVPLDLLAQVPGDLAVVLAQVLPGHASTAGSASRGDDVGGVPREASASSMVQVTWAPGNEQ